MAQSSTSPNTKKYTSPDKKRQNVPQGQALSTPKEKPRRTDRQDKRLSIETNTDKYLAPAAGLTVWTEDWTTKPIISITKTKFQAFTALFGENDSMHDALLIRNKTGIPNKTGYVHSFGFWKD